MCLSECVSVCVRVCRWVSSWVCVSECVSVCVRVSECDQVTTRRWYTSNTSIWPINRLHLLLLLVFGKKNTPSTWHALACLVGMNLYCTIRCGITVRCFTALLFATALLICCHVLMWFALVMFYDLAFCSVLCATFKYCWHDFWYAFYP